ncbi:MAG: nicotinamide-nucleotide amidohydrolase family protein [SAR202 cluster bacterium]|nr:nicotinamide-nucleotide amidohydrolase family protein [SAR202 cluster bacterium]
MDVEKIAEILTASGKTVSVAEADTAGLIGYMLGSVPGSSKYFPGGVIAYTGGLKEKVLGVADDVSPTHGTVSSQMAIGMAKGVRELTGTDYAVSTTGVTGPSAGRSGIAIGTFWIGLSIKDGQDTAIEVHLDGDRDACKRGAAQAALDLLGKELSR